MVSYMNKITYWSLSIYIHTCKSWIHCEFLNQRSVVFGWWEFVISKYDDLLYVLRTQNTCKPLYEIIIRELSALILHPVTRDIFYSISTGESVAKVADRHRITYGKTLQMYNSILKGLKLKKIYWLLIESVLSMLVFYLWQTIIRI